MRNPCREWTFGTARRLLRLVAGGLLLIAAGTGAGAQESSPCERAGTAAEAAYNLPAGLLLAIGRVESGRWDPVRSRTTAWPWAINAAGLGRMFDSKPEAMATTRRLWDGGTRSIDVGCFQINLMHHPNAFPSLEQAFDPVANARYAAQFLTELRARWGNWQDAVGAYHSANAELGTPYRNLVFANLSTPHGAASRVVEAFGMRVWTPSPAGTATGFVTVAGGAPVGARLPRVITPSR